MSRSNERLRDVLQETKHFLAATLEGESLSPSVFLTRGKLLQKLEQLEKDVPHLFYVMGSPSRQLSSPYVDMQAGVALPTSQDSSLEYVYSDTAVTMDGGSEETQVENRSFLEEDEVLGIPIIDVPASDLSKAEKTGYLEKKGKERLGGLLSTYQRRWCAIRDGVLYIYDKPTDKRQRSHILLSKYEARPFPIKDSSKKDAIFEIVCPGRKTYQFVAFNTKDMKQWISAIERNSIKVTSPTSREEAPQPCEPPMSQTSPDEPPTSPDLSYEDLSTEPLYEDGESFLEREEKEDWYMGLWDCIGDHPDELSFKRGDLLKAVSREHPAWWLAQTQHGETGLVPSSYLMNAFERVEE
uniref:Putative src kinase-associated phosphoprotein 2 n=1 Tax=Ornithodoros turicata TaxID=34597 RepID=A0A2R5LBK3_9ACAR